MRTQVQNTSYRMRPQDLGHSKKEQLVNLALSFRDSSERYSRSWRLKQPELYDIWRGHTTGTYTPTKNNVWIPLIYSTIWSDVARKIATHFAKWPVIGFEGFGDEDSATARKQEALVNAQLYDADMLSKEVRTFLSGNLYGTAISKLRWDHQEEVTSRTELIETPVDRTTLRLKKKGQLVTFDGPNYDPIDLLDFYDQPGFKDINGPSGMRRCGHRFYLDIDDCRFLASAAGKKIFDEDEVNRMIREDAVRTPRNDEAQQRRFDSEQGMTGVLYGGDVSSRPVEIFEVHGFVPQEFAHFFGGATNVVLTIANDRYLLRARENPHDHRQKPFLQFSPNPDPHYFRAPGKAEVAHQLQIAANRFVNHQLDAADLLVHPMFAFNRQMGINTRNLWAGPGRIFGVDGDPSKAIVPINMDYKGLQAGGSAAASMWEFIQMGSGVQEDTVMGMGAGGSDRQTAREFVGRREASGTRLMLESVLYDGKYLEPLGNFFQSMNHQFLSLPRQVLILGNNALVDPVTGERLNESRVEIDAEVLNQQYASKAMGTTMHMSAETEKANKLQLFQMVASASPEVAGAFNLVNFFKDIMITFGFKNVNELVQSNPALNQAQQTMGGASGPSGLIEGMGSGPISGGGFGA